MAEVYCPSSNSATLVMPLTEEEVRAYRHHNKRLARIVADQWLYASRFRLLALRFHKEHAEKLKRYCLSQWKLLVEERRRMCEILERASVLRQFLLERRSFHSWMLAVQIQQQIRKSFNRTTEMSNSLSLATHIPMSENKIT
ncbi:hypothetical protein R1sor_007544 [Riccia sorocarpa]|uniref:Uncharacterized protein n=1 Tax=Riccia sorocarpa TaxID=122646 RepID=A0ABD3HR30_9MARC